MVRKLTQLAWVVALLVVAVFIAPRLHAVESSLTPVQAEFFEKQVRPLLVEQCYNCHSAEAKKNKGGLALDSREGALKGGDTGPAIVPGDLARSLLIKAIRYADKDLQMPPKHALAAAQIAVFERWISIGAPDPRVGGSARGAAPFDVNEARKFWSFRPVKDVNPPVASDAAWQANPIDAFVRSKQISLGLEPAQLADRRTMLRRVTYDLTGLPPTPEEADAFLNDAASNAYEKLIDRLLVSPAYGEKWGRHWLDLVRYADTSGCNADYPIPDAYKYRNYVIDAFNADKPYDAFLREQLAGDLMPAKDEAQKFERTIATGYLAIARRFGSRNSDFHLTIDDVIDNVGKSMLGLSTGCARCHDHKFDPIAQADYYALYGIFNSTTFAFPGTEIYQHPKDNVPLASGALADAYRKRAAELAALDDKFEQLTVEARPLAIAEEEAAKLRATGKSPPGPKVENRFIAQFALTVASTGGVRSVASFSPTYTIAYGRSNPPRTLAQVMADKKVVKARQKELGEHPLPVQSAYAVEDKAKCANGYILKKGDPLARGDEVPRGFLAVLGGQKLPATEAGSGRLELANWIASKDNPLTARVIVNRVWQDHFGKGIVQTPNDFGARGKPPTHPELLDYLTSRFIESGWSIKSLHKLILTSRAYQLASEDEDAGRQARDAAIDVANDYLAHFNRRRMEAEEVRDSMLAIAGALERGEGGPHPFPPESEWKYTQHSPFVADYPTHRRAVYLMQQRIRKQPFLETFDGADTNAVTGSRARESSPIQALFFMNDPLAFECADKSASRVESVGSEEDERINAAFKLCLARSAESEERFDAHEYLRDVAAKMRAAGVEEKAVSHAAWASYLRVVLGSDEFFYVD